MDKSSHQTPPDRLTRLLGFLERDPRNGNLLADAAEEALRAGKTTQARAFVGRGLEAAEKPELRFRLGTMLLALRDFSAASELFADLIGSLPSPAVRYNLAYAQMNEGRLDDAAASLQQIANRRAELPQFDLLHAKILYSSRQLEAAFDAVNAYLATAPNDREALGLKAMLALDLNQPELAAELSTRVLVMMPNDVAANLVLGSLAVEKRDPAAARTYLKTVLDVQPDLGRAWSALAFADLQENRLNEARGHFDTAVERMPDHLGTWHGLAWSLILLGKFEEARKAVDAAMNVDRNFSENHGTLAVLLVLQGNPEAANAEIKRGLRLDPKSASSHYARSLLLADQGAPDASRKLIERILKGSGIADPEALAAAVVAFRPGQRRADFTSTTKH
jgi:tetratricopeptide (TPR) repeat protein